MWSQNYKVYLALMCLRARLYSFAETPHCNPLPRIWGFFGRTYEGASGPPKQTTSLCDSLAWTKEGPRARICRPLKELRNRFPAWQVGTTTLYLSYRAARLHRLTESIPGPHKLLQIRAQVLQHLKAKKLLKDQQSFIQWSNCEHDQTDCTFALLQKKKRLISLDSLLKKLHPETCLLSNERQNKKRNQNVQTRILIITGIEGREGEGGPSPDRLFCRIFPFDLAASKGSPNVKHQMACNK